MKKKKNKIGLWIKRIGLLSLILYAGYVLFQQQLSWNAYKNQKDSIMAQIASENQKTQQLKDQKALYNTDAYNEKVAREKLGLVKQEEKVFVDVSGN